MPLARPSDHALGSRPARGSLGCVLAVADGVYEVWTSQGRERASMCGVLLAEVARDAQARPALGDWVELTRWHDGRVTLSGRAGLGRPSVRPHLRLVK